MPIRECAPAKHLYIGMPCYTGQLPVHVMHSLLQEMSLLGQAGILAEPFILAGNCYLDVARNQVVEMFLRSQATDLLFWDADVAVETPGASVGLAQLTKPLVGGIYPKKTDTLSWPVLFNEQYMIPQSDGTIQAHCLPTGFLRINRQVFVDCKRDQKLATFADPNGMACTRYFRCDVYDGKYHGEDFLFTKEWCDIGGQCWVLPNIDFAHYGYKAWKGNYFEWGKAEAERRLGVAAAAAE